MKAPWHLWVVGILSLIWNAFGAADYVMTQLQYEPYMAQFTEFQRAYFASFPAWVQATWALAVWLSVAGSLALLMRSKFSGILFGVALLCMAATFLHNFVLAEVKMAMVVGSSAIWFSIAIICVAVLVWNYARRMGELGVLR